MHVTSQASYKTLIEDVFFLSSMHDFFVASRRARNMRLHVDEGVFHLDISPARRSLPDKELTIERALTLQEDVSHGAVMVLG